MSGNQMHVVQGRNEIGVRLFQIKSHGVIITLLHFEIGSIGLSERLGRKRGYVRIKSQVKRESHIVSIKGLAIRPLDRLSKMHSPCEPVRGRLPRLGKAG